MKMKKWIKNSIIVALATLLLTVGVANAEVSTPSFFKKLGNSVVLLKDTWDLGSATNKIKKIWALDIEANHIDAGTVDIGGVSSGPLTAGGSATSTIYGDGTTSTIGADLNVVGVLSTPQFCLNSDCKTAWPSGGVWGQITGTLSSQTDLQNALDGKASTSSLTGYVPTSRTVNGNALTSNISLTASDVGAPSGSGTSTGTNTGDQDLSGLVPYSGASNDLTLGVRNAYSTGKIGYDATDYITYTDNTTLSMFVNGASRATLSNAGIMTATTYNANGSVAFIGNVLYPYNSTFLTLKGRLAHGATAQQIKVFGGTASGNPTMGEQLVSYYIGNGDAQIGGVDAFDGFTFQKVGTKQTTDGSQQAITGSGAVLTTVSGQVYQVHAKVVGKQSTINFAGTDIYATVKNVGGTATIIAQSSGAQTQTAGDWGSAGTFASFTASGADVRVSIQGKAGTTIDWRMSMDYLTY